MDREEALSLMRARNPRINLQKHMLAVEAVMRAVARRFGEDEELFGLVGLLHDLDYEETVEDPYQHGLRAADELARLGYPPEVVAGVRAHSPANTVRTSLLDRALHAVDPLTGLIVAAALITPSKKLAAIDAQFVQNRMNEKGFARGANREQIRSCEEFGLPLAEFLDLGVRAMQAIAGELGL
ncbi:MAG: HDIG domain-containing protein [Alicyclobacillus sp.]|nr:HDIG domain-containing protein [Alicyclobacillus sp.]